MRMVEVGDNANIDKFVVALRNHIGRAASKRVPAKLNWEAVGQMSRANGFEFAADYETFKAIYDNNPIIQGLVKNFNSQGIVLNVPGAPDDDQPKQDGTDSQAAVDKVAAGAAEKNLGDSVNNTHQSIVEGLRQQLSEISVSDERLLRKYGIEKDKVTLYQAAQHRAGNKISWEDAKNHYIDKAKAAEKESRRAARQAKPRAPRQASGMTASKFKKAMKGAADDFNADFADSEQDLGDVAWDLAGSMMYDPDIKNYVTRLLAKNSGRRPEDIRPEEVQEYITDEIYNAGTTESYVSEDNNVETQRKIKSLKRQIRSKITDFKKTKSDIKKTMISKSIDQLTSELQDVYDQQKSNGEISEISQDLKARYKEKAGKEVKSLKPWTKKGEYKDLAKNQVARREKGIAKATNERDEGKPGKNFKKIANKAAKKYHSKEAGNRVAGAIRKKVLAKESNTEGKQMRLTDIGESAIQDIGKKIVKESTEIAEFPGSAGNINLTQFAGKEGVMVQVSTGYQKYIQLSKDDAAKVAKALAQWAMSKN